MSAHRAAASRERRGRSSRPTSVANVCSAGPPAARRRRSISRSGTAWGRWGSAATAVTSSTQPSTSASVVSRRSRVACCSGVFCRPKTPPDSARWSASVSARSTSASCDSSAERSMVMPRA
ncbi:Uncharacterised protein [Mycobacteroides abscessus]|nr:Uncharacterised protein [Mycobacteroides abscessus]